MNRNLQPKISVEKINFKITTTKYLKKQKQKKQAFFFLIVFFFFKHRCFCRVSADYIIIFFLYALPRHHFGRSPIIKYKKPTTSQRETHEDRVPAAIDTFFLHSRYFFFFILFYLFIFLLTNLSNFSRFNPHTWQNIFLLLLIPHFSCFSTKQVHSRLLILVQLFVFLVRESRFTCRKTVVVDTHKMGEKKQKNYTFIHRKCVHV